MQAVGTCFNEFDRVHLVRSETFWSSALDDFGDFGAEVVVRSTEEGAGVKLCKAMERSITFCCKPARKISEGSPWSKAVLLNTSERSVGPPAWASAKQPLAHKKTPWLVWGSATEIDFTGSSKPEICSFHTEIKRKRNWPCILSEQHGIVDAYFGRAFTPCPHQHVAQLGVQQSPTCIAREGV